MTQEFVTLPREVVEQAQMWIPLLAEIAGLDPEKTAAEFSEFADGRPASEFTIAGVITALRAALEQPTMSGVLRDLIEGMSISVDVSTGDHDAGHRYFGTVTEVMDAPEDKHGVTLLVQDAEPNFEQSQGEQAPVAWLWVNKQTGVKGVCFEIPAAFHPDYLWRHLYTHPQPAQKPLTDDQVLKAVRHLYQSDLPVGMGFSDDLDVARAIEAAHNIK